MQAGADHGLIDAGYRAIELLRLEKGYVYWSSDVTPDTNPYEAGLGFAVALDKGDFIGREALRRLRAEGPVAKARHPDRRWLCPAHRRRDDPRRRQRRRAPRPAPASATPWARPSRSAISRRRSKRGAEVSPSKPTGKLLSREARAAQPLRSEGRAAEKLRGRAWYGDIDVARAKLATVPGFAR